jgi:LmbE family N-acetylglucosaminyl deacetylase
MIGDHDAISTGNAARLAARSIADGGTASATWTAWDQRFPPLEVEACPGLVLVAPHPDDETLGLGVTAALLSARGVDVQVVSVTDGGAAYPALDTERRSTLEKIRRAELRRATRLLGLAEPICLALPDGEIADHEELLASELAAIISRFPTGTWCAATWRGDGHPDHEAVGRAAAVAARRTETLFVEYPVWMWHWATPADPAVPWHRARAVPLTFAAVDTKRQAAQCFHSQLDSTADRPAVLPPFVLQRLMTVGEVVFV